jgi:pre-rRNA-processing protein TSR3
MFLFLPTIILRHRKENLKKCTLRGLEGRSDFQFFTYPKDSLPDLSKYFLLTIDAPLLTIEDKNLGVFLMDGTWNYVELMQKQLPEPRLFQKRSLPSHFRTAYPRRQEDCPDPSRGLSSIEAIYVAYRILGHSVEGLLNHYYWEEEFLKKNFSNVPLQGSLAGNSDEIRR